MNRVGRRFKRFSDSKIVDLRNKNRRVTDADDDDDVIEEDADALKNLTPDEIEGLLELLPYKDALIKIAKGEFEIEKVEEADEDEDEGTEGSNADEENFEEDEDFNEEDSDTDEDDDEDYEEFEEDEAVEDSATNDAWDKRLKGNDN